MMPTTGVRCTGPFRSGTARSCRPGLTRAGWRSAAWGPGPNVHRPGPGRVGRLHLIDFDRVDLTNLNRQQYTVEQLGQYKTQALAETLRRIAPYCEILTDTVRVTEENLPALLEKDGIVCEAFDRPGGQGHAGLRRAGALSGQAPGRRLRHGGAGQRQHHTHQAGLRPPVPVRRRHVGRVRVLGLVSARVAVCAAHQAHDPPGSWPERRNRNAEKQNIHTKWEEISMQTVQHNSDPW